jgi:hypothetical protein
MTNTTKVFLIDPVKQSVSEIENHHIPSLISENVGADADCFKLDNHDNVLWCSDTDTNSRYAYYFEGMDYPLDVKRYSKALIISLGPRYWDTETILDWIKWFDGLNAWGDI